MGHSKTGTCRVFLRDGSGVTLSSVFVGTRHQKAKLHIQGKGPARSTLGHLMASYALLKAASFIHSLTQTLDVPLFERH